ncbi:GIY-YIG nuclease family protein [Candidatus Dependentiae bacterium]|nr:GIY-YIG nuclease family protein [Candidatus Dependentiae bacterium]MCC7414473.1 GIY-YIG nuclease family protein [Campylobacterota bacterium]
MKPQCPENLPSQPGVYFFKDKNNTVLYIGKATSLKSRVQSYFARYNSDWKVHALLDEHATVEFVITKTETEAALLEAELIQAHKPKYNILLTSGQPFVYIFISNDELPEPKIVRVKKSKGTYIGPFLYAKHAKGALCYLVETFRLMLCNKKLENGCLDYHLGLCAGSCRGDFNPADYRFRVELALDALQGNQKDFIRKLTKQMQEYSQQLAFEKAKHMRDYLEHLEVIFATLKAKCVAREQAVVSAVLPRSYTQQFDDQVGLAIQQLLQLDKPAHVIDCFDISHFQSTHLVGSCIRFVGGVPEKNSFRRFKIRTLTEQNDYAALREIVSRRYKSQTDYPDLILIDGGKGQLSAVMPLVPTVSCASLAKREERVFSSKLPDGVLLDPHTKEGKLLISLRDYTHHFAVRYHRLRRSAAFGK